VLRAGRLIVADAPRLSGDVAAILDRAAVAGGAWAMASIVYAGTGAEALLAPVRALLSALGGASLIAPGLLFARLLAADGFDLRASLIPLITVLAATAPPKVWSL